MTNVIIPTDFTSRSLDLVSVTSRQIPGKINAILFHAFDMPDTLGDAIRRTGSHSPNHLVTEELKVLCKQIKESDPMIADVSFKIMFGSTVAVFKNFAEANKIEAIVLPEDYKFIPVARDSVNPTRMFKKSGITLIRNVEAMDPVLASTSGIIFRNKPLNEKLVLR